MQSRRLSRNRARTVRSPIDGNMAAQATDNVRRDFLRDVTADLRYWYSSAESKAQLVLTVNGAFVTFLTTAALAGRDQTVMT